MSAIIGDVIYEVDDPSPVTVKSGDILVAATDGIETLTHAEIKTVVISSFQDDAAAIADALIQAVAAKQKHKQDNTTVVVVRIPD
jgi:serine/threonine protein phosphatase PrpC